jgi:hypothetical protein
MRHTVDLKGQWRKTLVLFGYELLSTDFKMYVIYPDYMGRRAIRYAGNPDNWTFRRK